MKGGQRMNTFVTGKIGMQVSFINQDTNFNWAAGTLPYDGDGPSRSARISNHGLQIGNAGTEEAVWTVFTWFMTPENAGRFPRTAGHVVSPFIDPAYSEVSQEVFRNQLGIDPRAYFLQAQQTRPHGWGMLKVQRLGEDSRPGASALSRGVSTGQSRYAGVCGLVPETHHGRDERLLREQRLAGGAQLRGEECAAGSEESDPAVASLPHSRSADPSLMRTSVRKDFKIDFVYISDSYDCRGNVSR